MPETLTHLRAQVARTIRTVRLMQGLSQAEVATAAGVGQGFVSALERGDRSPSLDTFDAICRALGMPPLLLLLMAHAPEDLEALSPSDQEAARRVAGAAWQIVNTMEETP